MNRQICRVQGNLSRSVPSRHLCCPCCSGRAPTTSSTISSPCSQQRHLESGDCQREQPSDLICCCMNGADGFAEVGAPFNFLYDHICFSTCDLGRTNRFCRPVRDSAVTIFFTGIAVKKDDRTHSISEPCTCKRTCVSRIVGISKVTVPNRDGNAFRCAVRRVLVRRASGSSPRRSIQETRSRDPITWKFPGRAIALPFCL